MTPSHPVQRRWFAEDLVRLRRADEQHRYVASQRAGRIDPNPHQIDAVIFALSRIPQGGCILADEVGLGKTIEAGLVIAQLRAEGAARVLLVTPKPLLGQWQQELATLFGIDTREVGRDETPLDGPGVFIVGREYAGSEHGSLRLRTAERFDLVVIDEAHEIFAGIYKRFDRHGRVKDESSQARLATRVREALAGAPVLLLTATPIQNSLTELWGLVQYVEPTGTLLGDLGTFRAIFCAGDDRSLREGQDDELRRRVATVCQRTLRRQAQEFMTEPFKKRQAQLFRYTMTAAEHGLYEDVTKYLLDPYACAFRGGHRRLLVIGFHRRMASSQRALAASLRNVATRLERQLAGIFGDGDTIDMFAGDLESDEDVDPELEPAPPPEAARIGAELAMVKDFIARADAIGVDTKAEQLVKAVQLVRERGRTGAGSGKVVIFTESLATQDYLREVLIGAGVVGDGEVTLFRGVNDGPRAREALARWQLEVGAAQATRSATVAMRLALVHEFATRSHVLISTEAGAKGLNLQFCDTVVNYDLPWNPQRIEQRIGRCHRYGQKRDVTVVNFLADDNEAEQLVFEILSRKLDLFGTVLDASDVILHEAGARAPETLASVVGAELEAQLRRIYERSRTMDEIAAETAKLRDQIGEARDQFEQTYKRTAGIIETRFDETVRHAFRSIEDGLAGGLAAFDRDLEAVVLRWLAAVGAKVRRADESGIVWLRVEPCDALPPDWRDGFVARIGEGPTHADAGEPLHLGHPLVHAAVAEARAATASVRFSVELGARPAGVERPLRARLVVVRLEQHGFEPVVHLVPVAVDAATGLPLAPSEVDVIFAAVMADAELEPSSLDARDLDDAIEEALFVLQGRIDAHEHGRFEEVVGRIEHAIEDRIVVLVRSRLAVLERRREIERRRETVAGSDARNRVDRALLDVDRELEQLDAAIAKLRAREDPDYALWMHQAHQRRYGAPRLDRILDVDVAIP